METRKLEIYTFNVHAVRKPENKAVLNNINGADLYYKLKKEFPDFVNQLPPSEINQKTSRIETLNINKKLKTVFEFNDTSRYITGKICIGEDDGKEQEVVKNNKKKDKLYTKNKGESIERPYYFIIILPLGNDTGFIAIEKEGKHSIKSVLTKILKLYVNKLFNSLDVKFFNFIEEKLIRTYLEKGEYNSITLSRDVLAKEKSQQLLSTYQEDGKYKISFSIVPKEGTKIPIFVKKRILQSLSSKKGFFEYDDFAVLGFDENTNVKIVSTLNNNPKTIDLSDTFKVRPYYIVNISLNSKGFSDFKSIHSEAIKLFKEFDLNIL